MPYLTNQWLKGEVERPRQHSPVQVKAEIRKPSDRWSERNQALIDLYLTREDGNYQCLSLTESDLSNMLPPLLLESNRILQFQIALDILQTLDDSKLIIALDQLFSKRKKQNNHSKNP